MRDMVLDRALSSPDVRKIRADVERQVRVGGADPRPGGAANIEGRVELTER